MGYEQSILSRTLNEICRFVCESLGRLVTLRVGPAGGPLILGLVRSDKPLVPPSSCQAATFHEVGNTTICLTNNGSLVVVKRCQRRPFRRAERAMILGGPIPTLLQGVASAAGSEHMNRKASSVCTLPDEYQMKPIARCLWQSAHSL